MRVPIIARLSGASFRQSLMAATALSMAFLGGQAWGAEQAATQAEAPALEEVVVTARRQSEKLQDVPITVSAFGSETLQRQGVQNLRDLNNFSPGLNFQVGNPRGGTGRLFMRGLSGGTVGAAKASVFVDGIYLTGDITSVQPAILERIEVLPGPQSAQFGRATFAGAVNYVTRDPGHSFGGFASADVATLGNESYNVYAGGPLVEDKVLFGASAAYNHFAGDKGWRNLPDALHPNGVKLGENKTKAIGAHIVLFPSENLKITGRYDQYWEDDSPPVVTNISPLARNKTYVKPTGVVSSYFTGTVNNFSGEGLDTQYNLDHLPNPGQQTDGYRLSTQAEWTVLEHVVTGTLAYNKEVVHNQSDGDFTYFDNAYSFSTTNRNDVQAEVRINSPQEQRLRYQAGGYYLKYDLDSGSTLYTPFRCNTICVKTSATSPVGGSIATVNSVTPNKTQTIVESKSAFGALFFDVTDKFTVSLEGRYQIEDITSRNLLTGRVQTGAFKSFLPRVNLQYKFTDRVQAYVVYSKGTNPGGFNTSAFIGEAGTGTTAAQQIYDEDVLKNYEFGIKSQLFDRRLQINASAYHMDWTGMQVTNTYYRTNGTFFGLIGNTGSSHVDGVGIEMVAAPLRGVELRSTIAYNRARYDDYCSANYYNITGLSNATGVYTNCYFVKGNTLETAPPLSGSFQASYTRPVFGTWDGFIRGMYQYQDGQWESDANFARSKPADVFNLNLGLQNETITAQIYCKNCTNENSVLRFVRLSDPRGGPSNAVNNTVGGTPRTPRQLGVSVNYKF